MSLSFWREGLILGLEDSKAGRIYCSSPGVKRGVRKFRGEVEHPHLGFPNSTEGLGRGRGSGDGLRQGNSSYPAM